MRRVLLGIMLGWVCSVQAETTIEALNRQVSELKLQTARVEAQLAQVQAQKKVVTKTQVKRPKKLLPEGSKKNGFHRAPVLVHTPNTHPEALEFYPTALMSEGEVLTYIAGTPVVTAPYLGARPSFDGSDYIVNISSINRDIRLMQQRRNLYRGFKRLGYPAPDVPIVALSGKVEPLAIMGKTYTDEVISDIDLGSDELDIAAVVNDYVEAYMAISYNAGYPSDNGQRVANSGINLNMGFVNIGDLDKSPIYLTAGQIYVPFGRYSTSMVSPTLPTLLSRTKARPFILGYKSQRQTGPLVSLYGFSSDTTLGGSGVGGVNAAYILSLPKGSGEIGASFISSIDDATGLQNTGGTPAGNTFGGFASFTNGNEMVKKIPGVDVHANMSIDRWSFTAEWVTATMAFREQDLSFNSHGARPSAGQVELGVTFRSFDRPSSLAAGYQWTNEALALNLPQERLNAVFNISIWKDTIESIEYRHDIDYNQLQYANGANAVNFPPNQDTIGSGKASDTVLVQLAVFF